MRKKRHNRRQVSAPAHAVSRPLYAPSATGGPTDLSHGSAFPPGEPIRPNPGMVPLDGGPRGWQYPVGYNIGHGPRAMEQAAFEALRNLAALYDGIQLCERVYFDFLGRLELHVLPREEVLAAGEDARAPRWREPAQRIEALLMCPDRSQDLRPLAHAGWVERVSPARHHASTGGSSSART